MTLHFRRDGQPKGDEAHAVILSGLEELEAVVNRLMKKSPPALRGSFLLFEGGMGRAVDVDPVPREFEIRLGGALVEPKPKRTRKRKEKAPSPNGSLPLGEPA